MDKKMLGKAALMVGGAAIGAIVIPKIVRALQSPEAAALAEGLTEAVDHKVGWHTLPTPLGLLSLVEMRRTLREKIWSARKSRVRFWTPRPRRRIMGPRVPLTARTTI